MKGQVNNELIEKFQMKHSDSDTQILGMYKGFTWRIGDGLTHYLIITDNSIIIWERILIGRDKVSRYKYNEVENLRYKVGIMTASIHFNEIPTNKKISFFLMKKDTVVEAVNLIEKRIKILLK